MPSQDSRSPTPNDHARSSLSTTVVATHSSSQSESAPAQDKSTQASSAMPITGVFDLIRRVYDGTYKRKRPNKADILAIRTHSRILAEAREELLIAASEDVSLANAYQLMAVLAGYDDSGFTSARDFAGQVLKNHPAFQHPDLAATLNSHPDALRPDRAVEYLASQDFQLLIADRNQARSKREVEKQSRDCKENAIRCLLLWLLSRQEISLDRTCQLLHHHVWSPYAQRYKDSADQLRILLAAKPASAVPASITSELLEKQITQQSYRVDAAQQAETRAAAKAEKLQKDLEELQREHAASLERGRLLEQELANQRTAFADEKAHLQDDYEHLRGTVFRRLKDELTLLEEGLHALQRDPPRVHVMVDHADRVIDGLRLAIDKLREARKE